ncbi:hypothetical protein QFZ99_006100 [Paraburkholderia atlantica]|uniref:hypothetical protein n=1 Tax=Paraburkholderia atlantica TaxID=2654982 RepID=UPI003D1C3088
MKDATGSHPRRGYLWSNLLLGKHVGGFTWHDIAEQMRFYMPGSGESHERLEQSLRTVASRHQTRWKHANGLALAWGVDALLLLRTDFMKYMASPQTLKDATGFDVDAIVSRWEKNSMSATLKRDEQQAAWRDWQARQREGDRMLRQIAVMVAREKLERQRKESQQQ